jgi:hypothetical protein
MEIFPEVEAGSAYGYAVVLGVVEIAVGVVSCEICARVGGIDAVGVSTPGGVPGPTSKFVAACPSPDELARDGT